MPLHITDTAGLRDSPDPVEQIGIQRAWKEIHRADQILVMVDSTTETELDLSELLPGGEQLADHTALTIILNKCDLSGKSQKDFAQQSHPVICLSAKSGQGMDELRKYLKECMGYQGTTEGGFTARKRHIEALQNAQNLLITGREQLLGNGAGELLAEDLRHAQNHLSEITGEFTSDDLLGRIFSSFCIGK